MEISIFYKFLKNIFKLNEKNSLNLIIILKINIYFKNYEHNFSMRK